MPRSTSSNFFRNAMDQISLDQQLLQKTFNPINGRSDVGKTSYLAKSADVQTSQFQRDISSMLKFMGISHSQEVTLNNGYSADIFIRPETDFSHFIYGNNTDENLNIDYSVHSNSLGTVIEVDGPFHFETYMLRLLGPTSMKHRHIRQSGYNLVVIPYWAWNKRETFEQKTEKIVSMLSKSCKMRI